MPGSGGTPDCRIWTARAASDAQKLDSSGNVYNKHGTAATSCSTCSWSEKIRGVAAHVQPRTLCDLVQFNSSTSAGTGISEFPEPGGVGDGPGIRYTSRFKAFDILSSRV